MNEFVGTVLEGAGAMWDDVFDVAWIEEQPHVTDSVSAECVDEDEIMDDVDEEDPLEWRMIYRASKGTSATSLAIFIFELSLTILHSSRSGLEWRESLYSHGAYKWPNHILAGVQGPSRP